MQLNGTPKMAITAASRGVVEQVDLRLVPMISDIREWFKSRKRELRVVVRAQRVIANTEKYPACGGPCTLVRYDSVSISGFRADRVTCYEGIGGRSARSLMFIEYVHLNAR